MRNEGLKTSRNEILESILARIKTWDMSVESGIEIIEANKIDIKKIQGLNKEITQKASKLELEEDYKQKIEAVSTEMKNFLEKMEEEKKILLEEKKLFVKNSDNHTNYIPSDFKAVFIDKNA